MDAKQPLLHKSRGDGGGTATSSFWGTLVFSWMTPLLAVGSKKTISLEDIPPLERLCNVNEVFTVFRTKLGEQVSTLKLVKALFFATRTQVLCTFLFSILSTLASYVGPYLIDAFVQYLSGRREFEREGYVLVSAFFMAKIVECVSQRHWYFQLQRLGTRARGALIATLYEKGQALSNQSKQDYTSGEIVNLMSVDAERIGDFGWYLHEFWTVPVRVILALLILYKNLGWASLAALASTVVVMLANIPIGKMQKNFQKKLMEAKDGRMKRTSEVLRNMRILKLQGWEMKFFSKLVELRKTEEGWLRKKLYTSAMASFIFWGAPSFLALVTFGTCILTGTPLETGKVLSAIATFRILQESIYNLPSTISMIAQTKVSLDRITAFLRLNEMECNVVEKLPTCSDVSVEITNGNFSWDPSSSVLTLADINFSVSRGTRVAVCGTVGSGKSTLLSCVLGEVPKLSGTIRVSRKKAYVAQSAWIQSGTIEENILFGCEMDRDKYERVLEACSLKQDLEILSFGDQTVIGERGINLSGGQKQRIQIARALYEGADLYLLDDPFSAVDAHTGTHLFKECILGLLSSKTVIYVTHQLEFLASADVIMVMKDGKITQMGNYDDIQSSGSDLMELIGAHNKALSVLNSAETNSEMCDNIVKNEVAERNEIVEHKIDKTANPKAQLVQDEEREKGSTSLRVYWKYITTAYRGALVPFILAAQGLFQVLQIASNYWMALAAPVSHDAKSPVNDLTLILVYAALSVGGSLCILMRAGLLVTAGYKTATVVFNRMHLCIFRAPMSFFDATPSSRILNRASTDQTAVDLNLPFEIGSFAFSIIQLVGIIAVMSQVAWPVFIIFIPVTGICIWYQQYCMRTARELARLVGVCKAPLIQHFTESIAGSTTIKSFDKESRFMDTNLKLTDVYAGPKFYSASAMEWLCLRLDMLSSITFAFSLIFLISLPEGTIAPGIAGLAVTYGLNLNTLQGLMVWILCDLENRIVSVERILQYTRIANEPPLVIEALRPDSHWPCRGEIEIYDLKVRYAPHMPLVLQGLTCTIHGGAKTGIVGRTGSGKSTLVQTLFRMVEPASGRILMDGVDISTIGLHDLRSKLSVIPQDPTMFEGTVRSNLDPLEEHTDEQIWEALDKCQLGEEVRNKDGKLDSIVAENGDNWSMGQRQLVCLGRVLLKKSRVLVLDEATASVDAATDNSIQQTLRQHFSDSTVITIAHRITSVLHSDMVLLLDQGRISEYDSPARLLDNRTSSFAKLVAEYTHRSSSLRSAGEKR